LFEVGAGIVLAIAVGIGLHDLYMYHGPTGVWDVSHKLDDTSDWAHPAPFNTSAVRYFDNTTTILTEEECDYLVELTDKTHDYNGYAKLRGIDDEQYNRLEASTEKVIDYINAFSGRSDKIDHLALRRTPRKGVRAHADNMHWEKSNSSWVPNGSGHRTWSATVLLNHPHEYEGGTFRFHEPKREDIKPGKGQLIVFDASEKNVHSVDTVPTGHRYTLLVWLSESHGEHRKKRYFLW